MAWPTSNPFSPQNLRDPYRYTRPPVFPSFTPYKPPQPPSGSYDPALDSQERAASRGLGDLEQDIRTGGLRDVVDYGLGRDDALRARDRGYQDLDLGYGRTTQGLDRQLTRGRFTLDRDFGRGNEDLDRSFGRGTQDLDRTLSRGMADLGQNRARGREDYDRNVGLLTRSYRQLAGRQQQQQNAYGVQRGGAALQAAAKRAENEAIDRQPLDTSIARFMADNDRDTSRLSEDVGTSRTRLAEDVGRSRGRLGEDYRTSSDWLGEDVGSARRQAEEDYGRQRGRLGQDTDLALGRLALEMAPPDASNPVGGRRFQDRITQLTRAQRENAQFGLDVTEQRHYQAGGAGWAPPARGEEGGPPSNQFTTAGGRPYQTVVRNGWVYRVGPDGRPIGRARRQRGR